MARKPIADEARTTRDDVVVVIGAMLLIVLPLAGVALIGALPGLIAGGVAWVVVFGALAYWCSGEPKPARASDGKGETWDEMNERFEREIRASYARRGY